MKNPKMIIFDYGQTLIEEEKVSILNAFEEVLKYEISPNRKITAKDIKKVYEEIYSEVDIKNRKTEVSNLCMQNYIMEYFKLKFSISNIEIEEIFYNALLKEKPTNGVDKMLEGLQNKGIRTGIICNSYNSGAILTKRINKLLPKNKFEFIISTSDYLFRKPSARIFEIAKIKANLEKEDIWYCGDNVLTDIEGAGLYGFYPIWYKGVNKNCEYLPLVKHKEINNWEELLDIL